MMTAYTTSPPAPLSGSPALLKRALYGLLRLFVRNRAAALPLDGATVRRILIFRYDRLGDMVVTLPMIDALRRHAPNADLHVLASPRNVGLLRCDGRIAKTFVWDGSFVGMMSLARLLRRENYDLVLCAVFFKMTYAGILSNILVGSKPLKITLAHDNPRRADQYALWFNAQIPVDIRETTMAEILVNMAHQMFGVEFDAKRDVRFELPLDEQLAGKAQQHVQEVLRATASQEIPSQDVPRSRILLNMSAGESFREWSLERNEQFVRGLCACAPEAQIFLSATASKRSDAETLQRLFPSHVHVLPATNDVLELCAFVRCMDYVITPDTALTHIATAFAKPTLVLCTPISSSAQWMPFGVAYRALYASPETPIEAIEPEAALAAFVALRQEVEGVDSLHSFHTSSTSSPTSSRAPHE